MRINILDCSCENKRLMEISQDLGHRPIIFIRFNPDAYITNKTKIASCWEYDKNNIWTIKRNKVKEWDERLNVLKTHVNYWINPVNISGKTVEIIQLYFDN
jgi:hypothetical protein